MASPIGRSRTEDRAEVRDMYLQHARRAVARSARRISIWRAALERGGRETAQLDLQRTSARMKCSTDARELLLDARAKWAGRQTSSLPPDCLFLDAECSATKIRLLLRRMTARPPAPPAQVTQHLHVGAVLP